MASLPAGWLNEAIDLVEGVAQAPEKLAETSANVCRVRPETQDLFVEDLVVRRGKLESWKEEVDRTAERLSDPAQGEHGRRLRAGLVLVQPVGPKTGEVRQRTLLKACRIAQEADALAESGSEVGRDSSSGVA
jgi:hypothetical protein